MRRTLTQGELIQLDPESPWGVEYGPLLCVVEKAAERDVLCYVFLPRSNLEGPGPAYLRVKHGEYVVVGRVHWPVRIDRCSRCGGQGGQGETTAGNCSLCGLGYGVQLVPPMIVFECQRQESRAESYACSRAAYEAGEFNTAIVRQQAARED